MKLANFDTTTRYRARVKLRERLTPPESPEEVWHLELELEKHGLLSASYFQSGQLIGVIVPPPHDLGMGKTSDHEHFRLYALSAEPVEAGDQIRLEICVRRCFYIDDYNGEEYAGIASNFLCDRQPGEYVTIAGPYGQPFPLPKGRENLLLIGLGTGIAPFRALIKRVAGLSDWKGQVLLFHGSRTGMDQLYANRENDDLYQYFDRETFQAFSAHSKAPYLDEPVAIKDTLVENSDLIVRTLREPGTVLYVAGLQEVRHHMEEAMAYMHPEWESMLERMKEEGRYFELVY